MMEQIITDYNEAVFDTDREAALRVVRKAEASGIAPEDIVLQVMLPAMDRMIKSISENHDANLAHHFITAQIASAATAELVGRFKSAPQG
jgi:methanogenic corrinoid protein MtbC1